MRILFLLGLSLALTLAEKQVTILAIYSLNPGRTTSPYDVDITVTNLPDDAKLIDVMDAAVDMGSYTYDKTVHTQWGAFITAIDGKYSDPTQKQYWQILGGSDMSMVPLGASSYEPVNGEKILFRLVTWDTSGH